MDVEPERILLVDDEPRVLSGLRRAMGKCFDISCAQSGAEALGLAERSGPFAVMICDLKMPGMDGHAVLREFKRRFPFTVRMVLSGTGDMEQAVSAINQGEIFRFHIKPVPTDVLLASVEEAAALYRRHVAFAAAQPQGDDESAAFRSALANNEMRLYVQPQMRNEHHTLRGIEALARWEHPTRGLLHPGDFLAMGEACGAMGDLTDWMLEAACAAAAGWRKTFAPGLTIGVNITASDVGDPGFPQRIARALGRHGLPPEALELELVEGMALDGETGPRRMLKTLAAMGVGLAIDDFGTGYSALGYLRNLPMDVLKIDRIFVADLETDGNARRIVEAIIRLGWDLGLEVIAEGIETRDQMRILREAGCRTFQGYLIARPMPAADFPAWFASNVAATPAT